jgi:hypothetical protein
LTSLVTNQLLAAVIEIARHLIMTPKEREAIRQALASTIELLNDVVSALNTVRGAAAVMGEGLERVQEDLASIARLIGSDGETPELRPEGRRN